MKKSKKTNRTPIGNRRLRSGDLLEAWRVEYNNQTFTTCQIKSIIPELEWMEVGESSTITKIKIKRKDLDNLPEFEGF